jgi:rod shape-determining protein MreC
MKRKRLQAQLPFVLVGLVLVAVVLHRAGLWEPVENLLAAGTTPVQGAVNSLVQRIDEIGQTARDLRDLRERNEALEAENARLLLDIVRLREIEVEAALQSDLLNFKKSRPAFDIQGAHVIGKVIGRDPSNVQRYVTLDVGLRDGVDRNMPVITNRGLVGRISEVGETWSRVLLITDVSSSVSAVTQGTRASGLVQGQADGSLVMGSIPQEDVVSVGDTVFTSGLGGNLPRQILIGQIVRVERKDYELYQTAIVQPTVDFRKLEAVLVITDFEPIEPAESEEKGQ